MTRKEEVVTVEDNQEEISNVQAQAANSKGIRRTNNKVVEKKGKKSPSFRG